MQKSTKNSNRSYNAKYQWNMKKVDNIIRMAKIIRDRFKASLIMKQMSKGVWSQDHY